MATDKPLRNVVAAFQELAIIVSSPAADLSVERFSYACLLFSSLFEVLERAFKFAKIDYIDKVNDLSKASSSISTLEIMLDQDIKAGCARDTGSHTRNLLKIKRALEMIQVLFEEIIATNANSSLKDAAFKAYSQVLAPYHGYGLTQSAASGMGALPSRKDLLDMINESEETAKKHMQIYVTASKRVTLYIDKLFRSKNLGINW